MAKQKKKKKLPVYNLNIEQIRALQKNAYEQALDELQRNQRELINQSADNILKDNIHTYFYMPLFVLHDFYGFGKKRLIEFTNYMLDIFSDWNDGFYSVDDIKKMLFDETGFDIDVEAHYKDVDISVNGNTTRISG